jgi:hypothetical protein
MRQESKREEDRESKSRVVLPAVFHTGVVAETDGCAMRLFEKTERRGIGKKKIGDDGQSNSTLLVGFSLSAPEHRIGSSTR